MKSIPLTARSIRELQRRLLAHYDEHRRDLPWRDEKDPYRILVSEVMLQQTRVETVARYYSAWLEQFPDLTSLAAAEADEVLKAWEGLGYYRRARNLHRAARLVRERPERSLPRSYAELRELPGVGEYTAGAVASIAFGEAVPAADGNVRRVLSRLFDVQEPKPSWIQRTAGGLVDPGRPGDWNQALMELGATVCVPRAPRCHACPVTRWCAARAVGTQNERPGTRAREPVKRVTMALAVLHDGRRVMLVRRPATGLLGGMWAFPERKVAAAGDAGEAALAIATRMGAEVTLAPEALPRCEHRFTHLHASYVPYAVGVTGTRGDRDTVWIDPREPNRLALPVAQRRVLDSFRDR